MQYSVQYACISHIGRVRKVNQDNFICDGRYQELQAAPELLAGRKYGDDRPVFGIFDGMGGEECGETAAFLAARNAADLSMGEDPAWDLQEFCLRTNQDICAYAAVHGIGSMGTTAAMLAFGENEITLCNIGDSKIFRLSRGLLTQISRDHVEENGFGSKPPLTQNLGIPEEELLIEPYLARGTLKAGDLYLISSDGLTDLVSPEEITEILLSGTVELQAEQLLRRALENGGRDNVTIILCKIQRQFGWPFRKKYR